MGRDTDDDLDLVQPEDEDPATSGQEVTARGLERPAASEEKDDEANQQ